MSGDHFLRTKEEGAGWRESKESMRVMLVKATRDHVWCRMKFPDDDIMDISEGASKLIANEMGLRVDGKFFKKNWRSWMVKCVQSTISDKRSSVSQSIGKRINESACVCCVRFVDSIIPCFF